MDDLKQLFDEVCEELNKISDVQKEKIKNSKDYLNDICVVHNYGKISGLLFVWDKLRKMIDD